jgi:hypothetical protein
MRRLVAISVLLTFGLNAAAVAVDKQKAMYVGGTSATISQNAEGTLSLSDQTKLIFVAEKGGGILEIPYKDVSELEYGQKVGRRWKSALLWAGPAALLFKGRKHFLTLTYKGPGGDQAAVLELGKDLVRTALSSIEARTGRKITYQDEEAAKHRAN